MKYAVEIPYKDIWRTLSRHTSKGAAIAKAISMSPTEYPILHVMDDERQVVWLRHPKYHEDGTPKDWRDEPAGVRRLTDTRQPLPRDETVLRIFCAMLAREIEPSYDTLAKWAIMGYNALEKALDEAR